LALVRILRAMNWILAAFPIRTCQPAITTSKGAIGHYGDLFES
jgi:hypothetical protein